MSDLVRPEGAEPSTTTPLTRETVSAPPKEREDAREATGSLFDDLRALKAEYELTRQAYGALEARYRREHEALALIKRGCELADPANAAYYSAILRVATEALDG